MKLTKRNGIYYIRRRVPRRYRAVDERDYVWLSLHTDIEEVAKRKAPVVWDEMLDAWEARLRGRSGDAEAILEVAKDLAETRGFRYLPGTRVASLPREELFARIDAIRIRKDGTPDPDEGIALLGGAKPPKITINRALDLYWTLAKDKTVGKSEDQIRRWRNPKIKAIKNLVDMIGDKPLDEIAREDLLEFRSWWVDRLVSEGLTPNSANKDLIHVSSVLRTVNKLRNLNIDLPLSDLTIKSGEAKTRPPFSDTWIREKLLAPGALSGLNPEARGILLTMINTGCRPSEIASLMPQQINIDAPVPHISIEPIGRQLKSAYARRKIPLLGVSLEAMNEFRDGFPRYRVSSATLSATVNKYLRTNGLLETEGHSLYSLRHSFEDRMLKAGIDDRIRRDVFGHRLTRERYGAGATLEYLSSLLRKIAL